MSSSKNPDRNSARTVFRSLAMDQQANKALLALMQRQQLAISEARARVPAAQAVALSARLQNAMTTAANKSKP